MVLRRSRRPDVGAIAVGIYPTNPWDELQYIVRHCGARVVVTGDQEQTDKVLDALADDGLPALEAIVCVDMKGLRHYRQKQLMSFEALCELGKKYALAEPDANATLDRLIDQASPDNVCILVYTSGTTGPPKARCSHIATWLCGICLCGASMLQTSRLKRFVTCRSAMLPSAAIPR